MERRKSAALKKKKLREEMEKASIAESTDSNEELIVQDDSAEANDDEVFENVEEMEVSLCQLINDTFRLDDDDLLAWKKKTVVHLIFRRIINCQWPCFVYFSS